MWWTKGQTGFLEDGSNIILKDRISQKNGDGNK
jgi:membrane-bound inhibitor of C-type lysozyme